MSTEIRPPHPKFRAHMVPELNKAIKVTLSNYDWDILLSKCTDDYIKSEIELQRAAGGNSVSMGGMAWAYIRADLFGVCDELLKRVDSEINEDARWIRV